VVLAMSGDDAAFGELVRRRQGTIRHLLRRLSRDAELADDLAQQTFMQAWQSIPSLNSPAAFGAWLRKLATNCWLQQLRLKHRDVPMDDDLLPDSPAASPVAERLDLDAALATLPPHARLCVVLAYSEGMSHAEIGDSTGLPACVKDYKVMVIAMANDADFELLRMFTQTRGALADDGFSASLLQKIDRARRVRRWRRILVMLCIAVAALMNMRLVVQQAMQAMRWVGDLTPAYAELLLTP
jgi:RNA polymerase sigma factor (sigma-70 family)